MVNLTQYTVRLVTLCLLWLIVRFTQYLLQVCDRIREADAVSMAELYLQCDIQKMVTQAAPKFVKAWVEV
ncbi:hypothetical protein D0962_04225 [Leptolyngbyaceae cyanobacterium CCMR0082]|uniref:Uncharacterized protein n=1 Tax=Adonisia turfae CCMR0082 TaxID=2304604 RepID=A0A6M0S0K7_9CYAN|nr:hypothetical protein [Adonisia turfae]NEZ61987.1 hypothetical protein [Adonisia turfae CCMR0082]